MPEIIEVEKLTNQLEKAWVGRSIERIQAPPSSPNPRKYAVDGWPTFRDAIKLRTFTGVQRYAKYIWVTNESGVSGLIHLSSTGWLRPGNEEALRAIGEDENPIHKKFLHSVTEKNIRVRFVLDDGQLWNYHDPRTWGKWRVRPYLEPLEDPMIAKYGPDWLKDPEGAKQALMESRSRRTIKDVLCDQNLTAGLGNYLACEILHKAGLHPHVKYETVDREARLRLVNAVEPFLEDCMNREDHSHWSVFTRKGETCPTCEGAEIEYAKDRGGSRGSYYCPECQRL